VLVWALAPLAPAQETAFEIVIDGSVREEPYSGRIYVALARAKSPRTPRHAMHKWFNPPPVFAIDVTDIEPNQRIIVGPGCLSNPVALGELEPGEYQIQAIARVNPDSPKAGFGAGDLVSATRTIRLDPEKGWNVELRIDHAIEPEPFEVTDRVRYFEMQSESLSAFHGRPYTIRAGVVVPDGFDESDQSYPVAVMVTGFGGDHRFAHQMMRWGLATMPKAEDVIWVVPDPTCYRGHSVFADSANNGPWGHALVHELLPALDAEFRGAGPEHRYVTGVSSGGWSSLWLQLNYPEQFAGCWSHVPDPVELHHFQTVDIYADGANMYVDENGDDRGIARRNGKVTLNARDFVAREEVVGPGGQIHSFEAVWSPRGQDGAPLRLFDRETGEIDPEVAKAWRAYDINLVVREKWDRIGPHLGGKVHVYAGGEDNFYLERAIPALQATFEELGSDAVVEIIPGMGHTLHMVGHADMLNTMAERWERRDSESP